jgi:DNA mismatch repair protein MutS
VIDHQTRRNLEITQTARDGTYNGSLLWALDRTVTAMGGRTLRRWLLQPFAGLKGIQARQSTMHELVETATCARMLQQQLKQIYDLERLAGRAGSGTANAGTWWPWRIPLRLPDLAALVEQAQSPYLKALQYVPPELEQLGQTLRSHLVENPPLYLTEGNLIRPGVNAQLDDLRSANFRRPAVDRGAGVRRAGAHRHQHPEGGLQQSLWLLHQHFPRQGQPGPRRLHPQANPDQRRTLHHPRTEGTGSPGLQFRVEINTLEYDIFNQLREQVGAHVELIRKVAAAVAAADVSAGLAEVAIFQGYCCPDMDDSRAICPESGRHPVVEQLLPAGFFVPNSTFLGTEPEDRVSRPKFRT